MPALKSIVLGSKALSYVRSFSTANMTALETLVMGNEAFELGDALYVTNVPRLRTLEIGSGCFRNASVFSLGRACQQAG